MNSLVGEFLTRSFEDPRLRFLEIAFPHSKLHSSQTVNISKKLLMTKIVAGKISYQVQPVSYL